MPLSTVSHHSGWSSADLRDGSHPLIDGSLALAPDNLLENPYLTRIGERGVAEGWVLKGYPDVDGHMIYVSRTNSGPSTMSAQNISPFGLDAGEWTANQPIILGQRPLRRQTHAANVPRPTAVSVRSRPAASAGFVAGTYYYAYTEVGRYGLETQASAISQVTVASGEIIRIPLPELSEDATGIRLYLSEPGKGPLSLRRQRHLSRDYYLGGGRQFHLLTGPYRYGPRPPSENDTYLGAGRALRRREVRRANSRFGLIAGEYYFAYTYRTPFGESLLSPYSAKYGVPTNRRHTSFIVSPPPRKRGTLGFNLYVLHIAGASETLYKLEDPRGTEHFRFDSALIRRLGGLRVNLPAEEELEEGERARLIRPRHRLVEGTPPEEDESGMEGPASDSEPDPPERGGAEKPPAGSYWLSSAFTAEGRPGVAGPNVRYDLPTGQVMMVDLPSAVNLLKNPEFSEVDSSGKPLGWTIDTPSANKWSLEGGELTIDTLGPASERHYVYSEAIEINRSAVHTFRGTLSARITAGRARVVLREYDSSGSLRTSRFLAEISASGTLPFSQTVSAFDSLTQTVRLEADSGGPSATARNLSFTVSDLAIHPYGAAQRKLIPSSQDGVASDYDPSADAPYHRSSHVGFGPPPSVEPLSEGSGVLSFVDFEDGAFPSDWSLIESGNASSGINAITTSAAIEGVYGWRNSNTGGVEGSTRYLSKSFGSRDSLGVRMLIRADNLPGAGSVSLLHLASVSNTLMAFATIDSDGYITVAARSSKNVNHTQRFWRPVTQGEYIDLELVGTQAGTVSGKLTALVGFNGANRKVVFEIAVNWSGRMLGTARAGTISKSNSVAAYGFAFDSIAASERGAPLSGASEPPAGVEPPPPDRPLNTDGSYRESNADGQTINQVYSFVLPADEREMPSSPRVAVLPGGTYTAGVFARHIPLTAMGSTPLRVVAYDREDNAADLGPLWEIPENSGQTTLGWSEHTATVVIPEEHYELQIVGGELEPGEYVAQEPAISVGTEVLRTDGAASSGGFTLTLDGQSPVGERQSHSSANAITQWAVNVLEAEIPDGALVSVRYRSGPSVNEMGPYYDDPSLAPKDRYVQIDAEMSGDGSDGPTIIPGGASVSWRHENPTLIRADGTPLPGGSALAVSDPVSRPDYETGTLAGEPRITPLTEPLEKLSNLSVQLYDPLAARELSERCVEDEWRVEDPAAKASYTVEFYDVIEFEDFEGPFGRGVDPFVHTDADIELLRVVEAAPLDDLP